MAPPILGASDGASGSDPFVRVIAALRSRGRAVRVLPGGKARAQCPSHSDRKPSLSITNRGGKVLLNCFAGCRASEIVQALGLTMADLFAHARMRFTAVPVVVAEYDYCDGNGEVLAQKVRFEPKAFRWRRPDPRDSSGWIAGLDGVVPGLYRWPDLAHERVVFLVEGEKAVDRLWALGLPSACPPSGASRWDATWSMDLWRCGCRDLVILPDADRPGREHAERVAHSTYDLKVPQGESIDIRVVPLPGLAGGADAYDWFEGGQHGRGVLQHRRSGPAVAPRSYGTGARRSPTHAHARSSTPVSGTAARAASRR